MRTTVVLGTPSPHLHKHHAVSDGKLLCVKWKKPRAYQIEFGYQIDCYRCLKKLGRVV